jgi:F-box/TPR repeat protein Pof3
MVSQKSLKIHLRRSNWTLERAIISSKAGIDSQKLGLITRYCKRLREVQFLGSNFIGDTLTSNLPQAKKLDTLIVGEGSEVNLSTVQTILGSCGDALVDVTLLQVRGSPTRFIPGKWPAVESLKRLRLKSDMDSILDLVSIGPPTCEF